jgi:hypothetical protein
MDEKALYLRLREQPPLPPWLAFPGLEPESMGWRMGAGETHLYELNVFLSHCSAEERVAYVEKYPEPQGWAGWYSGEGLVIEGARLFEIPEELRIATSMSEDANRLAIVGRREDGLYRVRLFRRTKDTWYSGLIWTELGSPSLVDSELAARELAKQLLAAG